MKACFFVVSLVYLWGTSNAWALDHTHAAWTAVLGKCLNAAGLVDYAALKEDRKDLDAYVEMLTNVRKPEFDAWADDEKKAFLINAYNALTIKLIVDHYPVKSIKDLGSFFSTPWKKEFFALLSSTVKNLDTIEHDELRPKFKDFRIHAAVNCASNSCPPLRQKAYDARRLDSQLDEQMRAWLADPKRNQYEPAKGKLKLSRIFDWYESDFVDWGGGVAKVVALFGPPAAKEAIAKGGHVSYLDYDWLLNAASPGLSK